MGHKDKTYVIFDGDNDMWAYKFMKGWNVQKHMDFNFEDAHLVNILTDRANDEVYIKGKLKERFRDACQVIVLIGESTKYLYKYIRWELEVALSMNLPIIAVNLNGLRKQDSDRCPAIIRNSNSVIHVCFRMKIITIALDNFPTQFKRGDFARVPASIHYPESVYQKNGLNDDRGD